MSERPNDASDGPIEEPDAAAPIDGEAIDLEPDDDSEPESIDQGEEALDEAGEEAEAERAEDEAASKAAEADVERTRGMRPGERRALRTAGQAQIPIDESLRIKDRASAVFVLVAVLVFGLIFLNGVVLGHGGFLTPVPTPTAIPTLAPSPSATVAPSVSPAASPTASPTAAPLPTATPEASPAPTAAPTPTAAAS